MKDGFGREIDYMRISITDRCNLRCRYCMPHGVETLPKWNILSLEEIQAIAVCAASLGVRYIKVTGGEPLVRKDCCALVRALKNIPGIEQVTLTTNGVLLGRFLEELKASGIDGINVSLDTLNPALYEQITGADGLETVLNSVKEAAALHIPVKINAVSMDLGEDNWAGLLELGRDLPVDVRFIELMPIGFGKDFPSIDHRQLLAQVKARYPGLEKDPRFHGPGPSVYYRIPGFAGSLGLISAIHGKFCSTCNRVRLTSQGYLKTCLCYEDGADLRAALREEASRYGASEAGKADTAAGAAADSAVEDAADPKKSDAHFHWPTGLAPNDAALQKKLRTVMAEAIGRKPSAHCFEHPQDMTEEAIMASIGG